ncbi:molybdate ABC transporter substrate-binding protein [Seohaeicola saemankumensis]|nr:molybdate ABC transporter substrate-binding protein [Seohaeicola saemankumensis]MCA0869951.1 molybdate ABC transporter substrate-binding protein [Seohaeicola saemankumensis]
MTAAARVLVAALLLASLALPARAADLTVFAAASLKTALDEVADRYSDRTGTRLRLSYAGSSALARQIQQGAPADLFFSANPGWMDVLEADGLLAPASRRDLLSNRLALIAGPGARTDLPRIAPGADLRGALGDGRLSMALVNAVPAGIYGKAALQSLGLWDQVADRLAQSDNVRAALRLVALGETPLGVVYATDAAAEPKVRVIGLFPPDSHPPIRYPVAIIAGADRPQARDFLAFLSGPQAGALFAAHGFTLTATETGPEAGE